MDKRADVVLGIGDAHDNVYIVEFLAHDNVYIVEFLAWYKDNHSECLIDLKCPPGCMCQFKVQR